MYCHCVTGTAKHQSFKTYPEEEPNTTNFDEALEKLKNNDKELKDLNLNNIKVGF
jgi:tropomodulin